MNQPIVMSRRELVAASLVTGLALRLGGSVTLAQATAQGSRSLMLVTAAATLLGIWKHIEGNIGFIHEMHPATSGWPLIQGALTGRVPLLASGVLAAAATTAIAATFAAGWSVRGAELAPGTYGEWRTHSTPGTS